MVSTGKAGCTPAVIHSHALHLSQHIVRTMGLVFLAIVHFERTVFFSFFILCQSPAFESGVTNAPNGQKTRAVTTHRTIVDLASSAHALDAVDCRG